MTPAASALKTSSFQRRVSPTVCGVQITRGSPIEAVVHERRLGWMNVQRDRREPAGRQGIRERRALAVELAPAVRVNAVAPGVIEVERTRADPAYEPDGSRSRFQPAGWGGPRTWHRSSHSSSRTRRHS